MKKTFSPNYQLTPKIARDLMKIEAAKERSTHLPLTPTVLASLRETARLYTTHYSTMIEGNRLDADEVRVVIKHNTKIPYRERDEREVKGYYAALRRVEQWAARAAPLSETMVQTLHALVMAGGSTRVKPTAYREGQNVIRDGSSRAIVYLPPEAKDVPLLMKNLIKWLNNRSDIPCPVRAAVAHYQLATIHPYYDGNGRTARLLTTLILHLSGYDLKGLYALEEYYAHDLSAYYEALSVGPSHNYYLGREDADISGWIEYFLDGVAYSFNRVIKQMTQAQKRGAVDQSDRLRELDPKQRKALELFEQSTTITARDIANLFGFKQRTSSALCATWAEEGFLEMVDTSKRGRTYALAKRFEKVLHHKA